jgi:hypothetical protein
MTLPERIRNFLQTGLFTSAVEYFVLGAYTDVRRNNFLSSLNASLLQVFRAKYGNDFPAIESIIRETQLYFINADPFFEYARPTQHNIIYMGMLIRDHHLSLFGTE